MSNVTFLGIDLAKNIFQLHGVDEQRHVVLRNRVKRAQLLPFIANLPACTIFMEACGSSQYWARQFIQCGHVAKLIAPKYVKSYVHGNKNDARDAIAIVEAGTSPKTRFVPLKTSYQLDIQTLHRIRQRYVSNRTAVANQIRGFLMEYGITIPRGYRYIAQRLPAIIDNPENELTEVLRVAMRELYAELKEWDIKVAHATAKLKVFSREDEACQRLMAIPGVGMLTATMLVATVGDPGVFQNGRHFAAYLGLVPKHKSSGERTVMLGMSKRGDTYYAHAADPWGTSGDTRSIAQD